MNNPILTIGIPAYNRTNNLENIIEQLSKEDVSNFVLLISDDASPDDPSQMINKYKHLFPNFIYKRNTKNLGFSENVCQIYDMAETPFLWFICDDDKIISGCISKIIESLKNSDPTVTILNHRWINPYGIEGIAGVKEDILYTGIDQIKKYKTLMRMTFLSTLILKKFLPSDKVKQTDFKNNVFIQITLGLMLLSEKPRLLESSILAIDRHVGFNYGEFFKFYIVDHLRAIFAIKHAFKRWRFILESINEIPTAFKLYISQKLGLFKYRGIPTKRTIKEIIIYYNIFSILIFLFIPLYYLIPTGLLKFIYKMQLYYYHPLNKAEAIFSENINRAYKDERKTKFTEYR